MNNFLAYLYCLLVCMLLQHWLCFYVQFQLGVSVNYCQIRIHVDCVLTGSYATE